MRLDEYVWSRNPRGMHCISIFQTLDVSRYVRTGMGWAKLLAVDTGFLSAAQALLANNITPIVRLYAPQYGAGPFSRGMQAIVEAFARVGVRWFEFYNEPNLGVEWPPGFDPTWRDTEGIIRPLMENWLHFAEYVASIGCYPGFPALAESTDPPYATVRWVDAFLTYLGERHYERFRRLINSGLYLAVHPYILNHFYQERPGGGPLSMRPMGAERSQEPGWHFEYPYDPICQRHDPGRTVFGGTALTPYGDPNGLEAVGLMINERLVQWFGAQAVPAVGTEGGIWAFRGMTFQQDIRYPPYNEFSQAEATVAMFEWIARRSPPWFFGLCLWKEDEYWIDDYIAPAVGELERYRPIFKDIPAIDVMGPQVTRTPEPIYSGPAPIHGSPNHHLMLLATGLTSDWLFDTARRYYEQFRPMITTLPELIDLVPRSQSMAVTIIAPPDQVDLLRSVLQARYRYLWIDMLVADDKARLQAILDERVQRGLRFG